ncbi:hypothetical protein G9A89_006130 [Geosiphon pyriformis]|nr:hypothetical protein G9A89_006130 [Geosiphon pyriformis]
MKATRVSNRKKRTLLKEKASLKTPPKVKRKNNFPVKKNKTQNFKKAAGIGITKTSKISDDEQFLDNGQEADGALSDVEKVDIEKKTRLSHTQKIHNKFEYTRGDVGEVFGETWKEIVIGPETDLLRPVGINLNELPQKVYPNLKVELDGIQLLPIEAGSLYLPYQKEPYIVTIGPEDEEPVILPQYQSFPIHNRSPSRTGYILNSGGSIWCIQWCPSIKSPDQQYLAVAGFKGTTQEHHPIGECQTTELENAIQIWRIDCRQYENDVAPPKLDLVICHEFGCAFDMKWCPYGAYDQIDLIENGNFFSRLGLLAGSFGDGTIRFFSVPHPESIRQHFKMKNTIQEPLFIKFKKPLFTFSISDTLCWTLSWGGHTKFSSGCTNGNVAIWNLESIIAEWEINGGIMSQDALYPASYVAAHNSCVRDLSWNSIKDPTHIMTCSHDGRLQIFDYRDPWIKHVFQRIRSFLVSFCWASNYGGVAFTDSENSVRYLRMDDPKKTTGIVLHRGYVWGTSCSFYHPFIATCSTDGTVKITNICRLRDRRQRPLQVIVYRLTWNKAKMQFRLWENIKAEETLFPTITYENMPTPSFAPEEALQRVAWCPNECAGVWLASGGAAGLLRIDCTDRRLKDE